MQEDDRNRIINRYNQRLDQYGVSIQALASGTAERRKLRFSVLTDIGISEGDRILDLGCGFGDYYLYLKELGINVDYTGVDINSRLIAAAQERLPGVNFRVLDIQKENPGEFDYIVSTSTFNLKLQAQDNYQFAAELLSACYRYARKGVAIDFLTSYVDFKGNPAEAFYYEPEKMLAIVKQITKRVTLRHDYPLFEFCLYLFPDFKGWEER